MFNNFLDGADGFSTVRNGVFFFGAYLGYGFIVLGQKNYRVVAKAACTGLFVYVVYEGAFKGFLGYIKTVAAAVEDHGAGVVAGTGAI